MGNITPKNMEHEISSIVPGIERAVSSLGVGPRRDTGPMQRLNLTKPSIGRTLIIIIAVIMLIWLFVKYTERTTVMRGLNL